MFRHFVIVIKRFVFVEFHITSLFYYIFYIGAQNDHKFDTVIQD